MKMCQPHWDQLRADVDKYGLSHLVSQGGEAAARQVMKDFEGTAQPIDFDPLMSAFFQLSEMSLNVLGLRMMSGDFCPSCELRDYNWTEGAAYQSRLYAEMNGLLLEEPNE